MDKLKTIANLRSWICMNPEIDYIAVVITPWHLLGALSFFEFLSANGSIKKSVFVFTSRNRKYFLGKQEEKYCKSLDINVVYCDFSELRINEKIRMHFNGTRICELHDKKIFIANPNFINIELCNISKQSINIIIDEGAGSYFNTYFQCEINAFKRKWLRFFYRIFIRYPLIQIKVKSLKTKGRIKDFRIFQNAGLDENLDAIRFYKKALARQRKNTVIVGSDIYKCDILFNPQPLVEDGYIRKEEYDNVLRQLNTILKRNNYSIALKPHPREENVEKYSVLENCVIDFNNKSVAQEILLSNDCCPKLIIGFYSSTLVTCKLFFDVTSVSLCDLINWSDKNSNAYLELQKFKAVFSKYVLFPQSIGELELILTLNDNISSNNE